MKKVIYFYNSFASPSGAEHVMIDFIKNTKDIDFFMVGLGSNKDIYQILSQIKNVKINHLVDFNISINSIIRNLYYKVYVDNRIERFDVKVNVAKIIQDCKPDIIYVNNTQEGVILSSILAEYKMPKIIHIHDIVNKFKLSYKKNVIKSIRKYDKIIAVSNATKKSLTKCSIPESKITVVYNGIRTDDYNFNFHQEKVINIGFIGSIIRRKGFDYFVTEISRYSKISNLKVTVISNSSESKYSKKMIGHLDSNNINYSLIKNVPRELINNYYKSIDIIIVPSRYDPLPTVVLEGIALGKVVLGSNIEGIKEMIVDDYFLFDLKKSILQKKIQQVLSEDSVVLSQKMNDLKKHINLNFSHENKSREIKKLIYELS